MKYTILCFALLTANLSKAQEADSTAQANYNTDSTRVEQTDTLQTEEAALSDSINVTDSIIIPYWDKKGAIGITLSQTGFSNWQSGGVNAISGSSIFRYQFDYIDSTFSWNNAIDLGYGIAKNGDNPIDKTDDHFDIITTIKKTTGNHWNLNAFANFRTQMTPGYEYSESGNAQLISDFMAPGYFYVGLGIERNLSENLIVNFSPLTGKTTYVDNQNLANQGAYGVTAAIYNDNGQLLKKGSRVRREYGGSFRSGVKSEILENVFLESKIAFFSNYLDHPQNIDVNFQGVIIMKVNKYISCNFTVDAIYDDDIKIAIEKDNEGNVLKAGPRLQLKEVFGAGASFIF